MNRRRLAGWRLALLAILCVALSGAEAQTATQVYSEGVEAYKQRVTLKLDRVPIIEVFRYMGELTGVSFQVQKSAIRVTPAAVASAPAASPAP